jgi:hypothetical protein
MQRPVLERRGKPVTLTADEIKLLDSLWDTGQQITNLQHELAAFQKRRDVLIRKAKERRFLNREIAEIASLSPAAIHYIVQEDK